MTTFAQWRSPGSPAEPARPGVEVRKYDIRLVDQFYGYCRCVSETERQREKAARAQAAMKRHLWKFFAGGGLLGYYLVERVAQAMSLF